MMKKSRGKWNTFYAQYNFFIMVFEVITNNFRANLSVSPLMLPGSFMIFIRELHEWKS
jgi:hypothetical protein